jgi:hypothetical protein
MRVPATRRDRFNVRPLAHARAGLWQLSFFSDTAFVAQARLPRRDAYAPRPRPERW